MTYEEIVRAAMRSNEMEGHTYTEEEKKMFARVASGEITPEEVIEKTLKQLREKQGNGM